MSREIRKSLGGGREFGKTGFFLCHKDRCKEIANNNLEAIKKMCSENIEISRIIFSNPFCSAREDALKSLIKELENVEIEALTFNIAEEPVINSQFLEVIESIIEAKPETILSPTEKERIKNAYIGSNTKTNAIENINENRKQYFIDEIEKVEVGFLFTPVLNQAKREIEEKKGSESPLENPSQQKLTQNKNQIKQEYNLSSEEFNLVLEPITDSELLEEVKKLISKVKTGTQDTDSDSLFEILKAFKQAPDGSLKKQAYLSVNSYQQQADLLISNLESKQQKRQTSLQELMKAQDEQELNEIYSAIKEDPELYQDHNQSLIDNHQKRVASALEIINSQNQGDSVQELVTTLRTIIASDSSKEDLISLEQKVQEYQKATKGEKANLYQQYSSIIDQMEQEIKSELTRRDKSEEEQKDNSPSQSTTPPTASGKGFLFPLLGLGSLFNLNKQTT
nr:828_t:CDS:2 [Entrophospora candida]